VDNLQNVIDTFVKNNGLVYRGPIKLPESNEGNCQIADPYVNVIGLQGLYIKK